jgi:murein DD-endopeptidase MepM/ murein hydrolase activator NlpD
MISKKRIVSKFLIILIIFFLVSGPFIIIPSQNLTAQSLDDELTQIKKEREEAKKKIEEVKKQEQNYLQQVNQVESQLIGALSQLDELNNKLAVAKSNVDRTTIELMLRQEELKKIEEDLNQKISILNNRVASIYKHKSGNIFEILFRTKDFIEFVSTLKLMTLIAQQDTKIIREIKEERTANLNIKQGILDLREKQSQVKDEVARLVGLAEKKKGEVEEIYTEKNSLLSETRADKNALLGMEKQLEIKESEITRILESYKYGNAPGGKFMWPVASRVRSGFGWRMHPIFHVNRFHAGIDLPAPNGTLVKAADGGEIIQAGYDSGYGLSIMVYHGGGFATWYAHLSSILVSPGQIVARGQVIGLVGATGWATGPHLHFEVRINGVAQNPLIYLQ